MSATSGFPLRSSILSLLLLLAAPAAALASAPGDPLAGAFDDDRSDGLLAAVGGLRLGGRLELATEQQRDDATRTTAHGPSASLAAWWNRGGTFAAAMELRHRRVAVERDDGAADDRTELTRGWLGWHGLAGRTLDVRVGRQDFEDRREWLYDRALDAARLVWSPGEATFELSAGRTPSISAADPAANGGSHVMASLARDRDRGHVAGYALYRDLDVVSGERRLHVGGRSYGRWLPRTESWLEVGLLFGERGDERQRGWALDAGMTWAPRFTGPVDFTVGYAVGSGGPVPSSGQDDRTFRQTGWQDNTASISGRVPLHYYGEALAPELSNLVVLTAGAGARLGRRHALDVLWHDYRQQHPRSSAPGLNVEGRTTGLDTDLGQGLDVVYGTGFGSRVTLEAVAAWFRPGAAFEGMEGTGPTAGDVELAGRLAGDGRASTPLAAGRATRKLELRVRYHF